jgi:hypothetical protein
MNRAPNQQTRITASATRSETEKMPEIHSLALRVRDLGQSVDWWNTAMIWGLALAAIAAVFVVLATRVVVTRTGQLSAAQELLNTAKDRQLQADLKVKDVEIGNLNVRAAGLEVEAATLRKQLSTQERRANVLMDPLNRKHFVARIAPFSGQYFDVSSCRMDESEIGYFSMAVWGTCDLSTRCTYGSRSAADGWSISKATMRSVEVVIVEPGRELLIAFFGVGPVAGVGPFAESSLNEAFGLAVGARGIGTSEAVAKAELGAAVAELVGAITTAVVGEQGADADAVLGIKSHGVA